MQKFGWCTLVGVSLALGIALGQWQTSFANKARPAGGYVLSSKVPAYVIAKGKASVKILLDRHTIGAKEAYMGILTALPGTKVPRHRHKTSAELLYILEGQGQMTLGKRRFRVHAGMAIYIPPNTEHSVVVDTRVQSLKALQVYAAPGPEQRFKRGKPAME